MSQMTVTYDPKKNKIIIRCPMWANDALDGLMSKRWGKPERGWLVPLVKRNVEFLDRDIRGMNAMFSAGADEAIRAAKESLGGIPMPRSFPAHYKFKTTPRKHQMEAWRRGYGMPAFGYLMGMGTGKSKTVVDETWALCTEGLLKFALVICRLTLRKNWVLQYDLHAPHKTDIFLPGTASDKDAMRVFEKWWAKPANLKVLVMGLESFSQGKAHELAERYMLGTANEGMVVVDESHNIANHSSVRTQKLVDLAKLSKYRRILTGSLIKDTPLDFFAPFEFLDPNITGVGDYYAFRNRYAIMGGYRERLPNGSWGNPKEIVGYKNIDELMTTVAPYVYQITKEEALPHLPKKGYERRYVPMTKEQIDLIRQIKRDRAYNVGTKQVVLKNVLEQALRMHQVVGGWYADKIEQNQVDGRVKFITNPVRVVPFDKNPKLKELFEILSGCVGRSVIIWAAYTHEIDDILALIKQNFKKQLTFEFTGRVDEEGRERAREIFQEGGCWMVGNTQTGGEGHTFTACEVMIYYNNTNKVLHRTQSEDRAHRDGLEHPVLYIDLVAEGVGIDQALLDSFAEKKDLAQYLSEKLREKIDVL